MYKKLLSAFALPSLILAQQAITVVPAHPVVQDGQSIVISADRPAVFRLSGSGTLTQLTSSSAKITAPHAVPAQHVLNGCMVLPNDAVFNTRVDNLPVHHSSSSWVPYISTVGMYFDYQWGTNVLDHTVPSTPQEFYYSPQYNGSLFQIPTIKKKREHGAFTTDGNNDHHVLSVNHETCRFYETYQDGDPNANCSACTASSGWTYTSTTYNQPASGDGGGTTDAAGLPLGPLTVHLSEILSGQINHALRFTSCLGCISDSFVWPALWSTGGQPGAPPMGARFRLKSSVDIANYPPAAQVVLRALQQYGMFLADVGQEGHASMSSDVTEDPGVINALNSIGGQITAADFEAVDESSFLLTRTSNQVNPRNPYQQPLNSSILTVSSAANPSVAIQVPIVIQPVTVGTLDPAIVVQAGTPGFQVPAWVNGSQNHTLLWTLNGPGTLSPSGVYTAPTGTNAVATATITLSSAAVATSNATVNVTIIPSGIIRIDSGSAVSTRDALGNVWLADLGRETGSYSYYNDSYPTRAWGNISLLAIWQTYLTTWGDDIVYRMHVPNGNYRIEIMRGLGECDGTYDPATQWDNGHNNGSYNLEAQGLQVAHNYDFGLPINYMCRTPSTTYIPATVTDTNLEVAMRAVTSANGDSAPMLNGLVVTPDPDAAHITIDAQQQTSVPAGGHLQLYMIDWHTGNSSANWRILQGPGAITQSGLYTAPGSVQPGSMVTVYARGTMTGAWTTVKLSLTR